MKFSASILFLIAPLAWAQNSTTTAMPASNLTDYTCLSITQMRTLIPSCALQCQTIALAADSCPYEDTACHCANTAAIQAVIEPCLANSTCSSDEVTAFAAVVVPVCQFFNATTNGTMPASCATSAPAQPSNCTYGNAKPTGFSISIVNGTVNSTTWSGIRPMMFDGAAASSRGAATGILAVVGVAAVLLSL